MLRICHFGMHICTLALATSASGMQISALLLIAFPSPCLALLWSFPFVAFPFPAPSIALNYCARILATYTAGHIHQARFIQPTCTSEFLILPFGLHCMMPMRLTLGPANGILLHGNCQTNTVLALYCGACARAAAEVILWTSWGVCFAGRVYSIGR